MSTLDNTGELRKIAEENYRAHNRPVDVGAIIVTAALALAVGMWAYPALDTDRFSIDGSRWAMAAASVLSAIVATVCGVYVLDRRNRKRTDLVMAHLEATRSVLCRLVAPSEPTPSNESPAVDVDRVAREAYTLGRQIERRQHQ